MEHQTPKFFVLGFPDRADHQDARLSPRPILLPAPSQDYLQSPPVVDQKI
jgi:hypothetical protein